MDKLIDTYEVWPQHKLKQVFEEEKQLYAVNTIFDIAYPYLLLPFDDINLFTVYQILVQLIGKKQSSKPKYSYLLP